MRKIAANYILLPGFEFVKNGYVVLKDGMVVDVVNTGGEIREIPCLEFYGGMLVDDRVRQHIVWSPGDPIREKYRQGLLNISLEKMNALQERHLL